ncbi:hypothetical protein ACE1AT_16675 [Pelatocladus sp. BLCC-F211]|uniref:hypothetical protein n=1 Tax=Pelatocladus sp. BLCC-F211 TaxID=3342752 RepID=UPI0035B948D8
MEPDKLIQAFTQVVEEQDYVFDHVAIEDISSLRKTLADLNQHTTESFAEAIRLWYINHESVRDAVLITEREITKVEKTNPVTQEITLTNQYRVIDEGLQKLEDKKRGEEGEKSN